MLMLHEFRNFLLKSEALWTTGFLGLYPPPSRVSRQLSEKGEQVGTEITKETRIGHNNMDSLTALYIFILISPISSVISGHLTFNVLDFGAIGDGKADDTRAIIKAWDKACSTSGSSTVIFPGRKAFLVRPTNFNGNCKSSHIFLKLAGTIIEPKDRKAWHGNDLGRWLAFEYVNGLSITGSGMLQGQGKPWWDISCRYHPGPGCGTTAPTTLSIVQSKNVYITGISSLNSAGGHIMIFGSQNVTVESVTMKSPGNSPNTDGIHLSHSKGVTISNTNIGSGDDCVSIVDRVYNVKIRYVNCGPGHGISIGSLGGKGNVVDVQNITVTHVNFYKTTNGARIKTKPGGGGQASHISFSKLNFTDVDNPIIIDQQYGVPKGFSIEKELGAGVRVHDIVYSGLSGTSTTNVAVSLNCSSNVPCANIVLENIQLTLAQGRKQAASVCHNAYGRAIGVVKPQSCLHRSSIWWRRISLPAA